MAKTFSVFKHKSRPQFDTVPEPEKNKKKRASRTVSKKSGTRARRSAGRSRHHFTRYEDTVNIYTSDEPRSAETEEKLNTATLNAIKSGKKTRAVLWTVFLSVVICILVILLTLACFNFVFKVEKIKIDGVTLYSEDEVLSSCGISVGDKMYSVNKKEISRRLIARFPYFKEVKIVREIPTGIVIKVSEDSARYYTSFCGEYCLLSSDMRVLELTDDYEAMTEANENLVELKLPRVSDAIVGDKIEYFSEGSDGYISRVTDSLLTGSVGDSITSINLKSRFNIEFTYDDRVKIEIGDDDAIDAKIQFALSMISEFDDTAKLTVSARKIDSGYVIPE